jgi:hypothetical protein
MGTNTGLGIGIGIPFKNNALGGDKPYFPPELKARMIGVWTNYGKKNTDTDRNIIKNKIPNAGGDLEILNAAYKLNSGFGEYSEDFTTWTKSSKITSVDSESFDFVTNVNWNLLYYKSNIGKDIPSFKVRIKLKGESKVFYNYITSEGVYTNEAITSEEYVTPISYNTKYTGETPVNCGFSIGITSEEGSGTITQIPNFEDAFVTDGINDMIVSQKTLQEMGVTKGLTIVSMIHQINTNESNFITTNNLRTVDKVVGRNIVSNIDKTGIYGWYKENIEEGNIGVINNILGDKADYIAHNSPNTNTNPITNSKFYVTGYAVENGFIELSSVAYYWTFAVLGKATEDEINLIIGNYNLDRSLKPDILCNIGKQGITNDNHADFNDKLVDYSGNSRDIQTYNLAWKGGSGIAAKPFETIKDYTIISDETRQKLTIYNEFSYKVRSNAPNRYWIVQSIIKDNTSYQVTIITDKDCYWVNATSFINSEGNKDSIKKEYPVKANTPTQVTICGLNEFEYPEGIEPTTAVSYVNLSYAGEITVTFIPSYKGGLLLDGINDFGKVTGMPIYKDYTFIIDREIISIGNTAGIVASKSEDSTDVNKQGAFLFEYLSAPNNISVWSFYKDNGKIANTDFTRGISYQSKYSYNGIELLAGTALDSDKLWLGILRDRDSRFANVAIYSLMSFPYSMSKFLIERQLKKHKLGTFYPNMVEFRPVIKANANYKITYYQIDSTNTWKSIKVGDYIVIGAKLAFQITFDNDASELKEVVSPQLSGIIVEKRPSNPGYNIYSYITSKSPQKINITIDEYIRFEDIVQPYPSIINLVSIDKTYFYTYGDKLKVGDVILYNSYKNLLKGFYSLNGQLKYNGVYIYDIDGRITVAKEMVFSWTVSPAWLLDNNEPKCILSPRLLRIPNSSYKILGYIPDISGHSNHGVIHNSAYGEGSGVNEDGSYQFDGVDDFVTIPTVNGGKQVFMKVNVMTTIDKILYDQRNSEEGGYFSDNFAIMTSNSDSILAYAGRNPDGKTYIDGILNTNITCGQLLNITHNITALVGDNKPLGKGGVIIGASKTPASYCKAAVYDFMLFDEISTDDKIQELNEYVGIEAKVELPPYYWDAYGKTNSDADKDTIQQRGIAVGDYDLINYNHAYEGMSGYNGYPVVFGAGKTLEVVASEYNYISDVTSTTIHITMVKNAGTGLLFSYVKKDGALTNIKEIPAFRVTIKGLEGNSKFGYRYLATEDATRETLVYLGNGTHELAKSFAPTEALLDLTRNAWVGIFITPMVEGEVVFDCDITIEVLPEYENGLAYDGITDYSKNANIPVLTDYTYIYKRTIINIPTNAATLLKGADKTNGGAFIADYGNKWQFNFGQYNIIQGIADGINWQTVNSFNGTSINKGENTDDSGITVAKFSNGYTSMVFYKLILYPKTISLLEINFLKNLMEKDEIIDLNNPIFIKNE